MKENWKFEGKKKELNRKKEKKEWKEERKELIHVAKNKFWGKNKDLDRKEIIKKKERERKEERKKEKKKGVDTLGKKESKRKKTEILRGRTKIWI